MSPVPESAATPVPAAVLNARIRALCAGRVVWSAVELRELARLRRQWLAAVRAERGGYGRAA